MDGTSTAHIAQSDQGIDRLSDPDVPQSSSRQRQLYLWVALVLIAPYAVLDNSQWIGDTQLHTMMEVVAATIALFVGAVAYLRFRSNGRQLELFVAAGFVGTAVLDGYHAVVTSSWFVSLLPSAPADLIAWSWNASRIYLGILLVISIWAQRRAIASKGTKAISERAVYTLVATLCLLTFALFVVVPLPHAYFPELVFGRPEEFVAALLFAGAFAGLYREGSWRNYALERWLMLSVLIACICQAVYMSRSLELFDAMFDTAHALKVASYVAVLAGLLISIYELYRHDAEVVSRLQRMAMAVESAADSIAIFDSDWKLQYVNSAYLDHAGWKRDEALGKLAGELQFSDVDHEVRRTVGQGNTWSGRRDSRMRDGRTVEEEASVSPVKDHAGVITNYVTVIRDVTEQKQLERQLIQAQKLESIGQLAAGIAHEINTPTQYVGDNTRFVKEAFDDVGVLFNTLTELQASANGSVPTEVLGEALLQADLEYLKDEVPRALEQSLEGVERVTKIVRAMKEFSHPAQEKTPVDLNAAIQSTLTVATNEWKYVAELSTDFDPELPLVTCLPGEFNQVILNIIVNAAHAIVEVVGEAAQEKGAITVTTRGLDGWAEICIADTGAGMPEDVKARVFDPFFTTKEVGQGTGQGLSIAHNVVVDKHGGTIQVDSKPGEGTCFTIRLPLEDA